MNFLRELRAALTRSTPAHMETLTKDAEESIAAVEDSLYRLDWNLAELRAAMRDRNQENES